MSQEPAFIVARRSRPDLYGNIERDGAVWKARCPVCGKRSLTLKTRSTSMGLDGRVECSTLCTPHQISEAEGYKYLHDFLQGYPIKVEAPPAAGVGADATWDNAGKLITPQPGPLPVEYYQDIQPNLDAADFVEGLLTDGGMSVVYGESGCGKTFLTLDLALHVAAGLPWFGREVDLRGVLYLALEGRHGIRNRVAAWKIANTAKDAELAFAVVPVSVDLLDPNADTPRVIAAARQAAKRFTVPVGLIVVDTLSRAMAGGNENAPDDMGALVRNLDHIRQELPAHVQTVHHSGKDGARGARGHSLLRAATDTEIEVTREGGVSVARVTKQRDLDAVGQFDFRLHPVDLGMNRRKKPVTSCVIRETEAPDVDAVRNGSTRQGRGRNDAKDAKDQAKLLAAIDAEMSHHGGATRSSIRDRTGFRIPKIEDLVQRLIEGGTLEQCDVVKTSGRGKEESLPGYRRSANGNDRHG